MAVSRRAAAKALADSAKVVSQSRCIHSIAAGSSAQAATSLSRAAACVADGAQLHTLSYQRRALSSSAKSDGSQSDGPSGGILGALNKKLKDTVESDSELKKAFEASSSKDASASAEAAAKHAQTETAEEPAKSSTSSTEQTKAGEPEKPSRFYLMMEDIKDVFAVTFGMTRQRDVGKEVDMGLREYAWVQYEEPGTGRLLYRNNETGLITEIQPSDWEQRSKASSRITVNTEANAVAVYREEQSPWDRTLASLYNTPIIQGALAVGEAVKASPVGQAAAKVKVRIDDAKESALEKWETSQHPLIVNSSYMVDNLLAETEHGRALREIRQLDTGFDEYSFLQEMRDEYVPALARAFFRLDMDFLRRNCRETALAQMKAVQAARDVEGLTHDGQVLSVSKVELLQARTLDSSDSGTLPVVVLSCQVQYIHCVRNKKKEIVEGSESEIRAGVFVIALTREVDPSTGRLAWKTVEVAMHGSQLYL